MAIRIFTMARYEHGCIREWVEHHLSIGFDIITICEHCSNTHYDEILDYVDAGRVVLEKNDTEFEHGKNPQSEIFNDFVRRNSSSPDWCAFIDTDEYIMLDKYNSIQDLLMSFPKGQNNVHLSWKNFGASGHVHRPLGGIVSSYTESIESELLVNEYSTLNALVKSIVRLDCIEQFDDSQIHIPELKNGEVSLLVNGKEAGFFSNPIHEVAWINHYITKSFDEFFYKNQVRWSESYKPNNEVNSNRKIEQFFYFSGFDITEKVKFEYPFLFAESSPTSIYTDDVAEDIKQIDALVNTFGGVEIYTDKCDIRGLSHIHPSRYRIFPKKRFSPDAHTFRGTTRDVIPCKCDIRDFNKLILQTI